MNEKKRAVNTPVSEEFRKLIKMRAIEKGVSMQQYLEDLLKEHWKDEGRSIDGER